MAPPLPPTAKCPTTVLDLDDDLLCEVFLRLPGLPSLVRAALSCRTFLSAVRSSPAFRRSFRALHPSPFVGLFVQRRGFKPEASSFHAHHSPPDQDFEAAARGGDFSLTALPLLDADGSEDGNEEEEYEEYEEEDEEEEEEASPVWEIERCCDGYVVVFNRRAKQIAAYNPLTRALHLYPSPPRLFSDATSFEFHTISSQEDPGAPPRVVCFDFNLFQAKAVVHLISPDSSIKSKCRKFPGTGSMVTGKMVNGSVYWTHVGKPYITVLDTTTLKFTKMDLPPLLADQEGRKCAFVFGNTKDGRPCIVSPDLWGGCSLDVFFWRPEDEHCDDGRNYWLYQTFPLKMTRQFVKFPKGGDEFIIVRLMDVTDGIMYLRTEYDGCTESPQLLLSFCLETAELKLICEDYHKPVHPYIMAWPPSLVQNDEGPCSKDQALSTASSEGCDVKAGGGQTLPASVAKA
ncbi:uncharacterized protein LOC119284155 [Triticum dicoccoides]|uniref:uncharacterized protein LOC119284155 n=1 Tax=Triticum dicoccoides TaxID=85692 RepID=UPI00188DCE7A|nr:uncharacterized protein LOC119284155 [Triticum dicoccoides]